MKSHHSVSSRSGDLLLGLVLVFSFALYANSIFNGFVFDDHSQIERNPLVHSFAHVSTLFSAPVLAHQGSQGFPNFYRPLFNLSFLLCYEVFGPSPLGFHLVSVLWNCVAVFLVCVAGSSLFGDRTLGVLSALVFALHPAHVESVAWIAGLCDPQATVFVLLSFWFFLQLGAQGGPRPAIATAGLLGAFALGLLAKETAMVLPVLVTVFEHFYRADRRQTSFLEKLRRYGPVWLTLCAYLGLRAFSVGRLVPLSLRADLTPGEQLWSALALIGQYAWKLVWPVPLTAFSPFQKSTALSDPQVMTGLGVCVVLLALFLLLWKRAPLYSFALIWMCLAIAPTLNPRWMTSSAFAERYLYLPSVGFSWLCAGALLWMWREAERRARLIRWGVAGAAVLLALLAARVILARTYDWRSDRALIVSTLAAHPDSPHMHVEYGMLQWAEGDHAEAERHWYLALRYKPDSVEARTDLGFARLEEKRYAEAIPYLKEAVALNPRFAAPHVHLARVNAAQGKPAAAEDEFRQALAIHPTSTDALNALGQFYLDQGRLDEAAQSFRASLEVYPQSSAWSALGRIYDLQNESDKAEEAWRRVLELEPFDPGAHRSLGQIYLSRRQWKSAAGEFEACLLMDPADAIALAGLKRVQELSGAHALPGSRD